jgi:hypothetical protein
MYPRWVQVDGQSGTTAWSEEEERKYYSQFKNPDIPVQKHRFEIIGDPEPVKKKGRGRPRKKK